MLQNILTEQRTTTPEDSILFRIDFSNFIVNRLDIYEMLLIYQLMDGYNISEIARKEEVSRKLISRQVSLIKQKFRLYFGYNLFKKIGQVN